MDEDWGIHVTTAGYVSIEPGAEYPPPGHPKGYAFFWQHGRILHEFQLHYITRGAGEFESETGGKKQIETGNIFLLFPGEWHRYMADPASGWREYWVGFGGAYATRLLRKGFLSPRTPVLKPRAEHALLELFTGLIGEMRAERLGFAQILAATTSLMLAMVHAAARAGESVDTHAETVIRRAKALLHERLNQPVELKALADELQVGYAWLRRNFRYHTGLALHQYHLQLRINRAMHLLSGTTVAIKEVADQTGFEDPHYFSRVFISGPLLTSTGAPTAVTFTLGNFNAYDAASDNKPAAVATALMSDFVYQQQQGTGGPDSTFSINNLNSAFTYDIYLYAQNGGYAQTATTFTISGSTKVATNAGDISNFVENTNYVRYTGIVPNAGTISGVFNDAAPNNNAGFNGLQIVEQVPEPTAISLLAVAGLLALRRRRA